MQHFSCTTRQAERLQSSPPFNLVFRAGGSAFGVLPARPAGCRAGSAASATPLCSGGCSGGQVSPLAAQLLNELGSFRWLHTCRCSSQEQKHRDAMSRKDFEKSSLRNSKNTRTNYPEKGPGRTPKVLSKHRPRWSLISRQNRRGRISSWPTLPAAPRMRTQRTRLR